MNNADRATSIWHRVPVADLDLCQTLHNLTSWNGTHQVWNWGKRQTLVDGWRRGITRPARTGRVEDYAEVSEAPERRGNGIVEVQHVPAYDLGYLIRKAPIAIPTGPGEFGCLLLEAATGARSTWQAAYVDGPYELRGEDDEPENALARLCIALVEHRIIRITATAAN